jgi:hypothetical protein
MTVALAPPICGDDVPPALINKSIQKFLNILIDKSIDYSIYSLIDEPTCKVDFSENDDSNIQSSSRRYKHSCE